MECCFCQKVLKNESSMKAHQLTKACLKAQEKNEQVISAGDTPKSDHTVTTTSTTVQKPKDQTSTVTTTSTAEKPKVVNSAYDDEIPLKNCLKCGEEFKGLSDLCRTHNMERIKERTDAVEERRKNATAKSYGSSSSEPKKYVWECKCGERFENEELIDNHSSTCILNTPAVVQIRYNLLLYQNNLVSATREIKRLREENDYISKAYRKMAEMFKHISFMMAHSLYRSNTDMYKLDVDANASSKKISDRMDLKMHEELVERLRDISQMETIHPPNSDEDDD